MSWGVWEFKSFGVKEEKNFFERDSVGWVFFELIFLCLIKKGLIANS